MSEEKGLNICGTLEKIWKCRVDNMLKSAGGEGVRGRRNLAASPRGYRGKVLYRSIKEEVRLEKLMRT